MDDYGSAYEKKFVIDEYTGIKVTQSKLLLNSVLITKAVNSTHGHSKTL